MSFDWEFLTKELFTLVLRIMIIIVIILGLISFIVDYINLEKKARELQQAIAILKEHDNTKS